MWIAVQEIERFAAACGEIVQFDVVDPGGVVSDLSRHRVSGPWLGVAPAEPPSTPLNEGRTIARSRIRSNHRTGKLCGDRQ